MNIGIIGLPQVGKKTFFEPLTGEKLNPVLKESGKLLLKGMDYVVEDGGIMHVRFNV